MGKTATAYIIEAMFLLKMNIAYVLIPGFFISAFYLTPFVDENLRILFFTSLVIALLIIIPLIYGQFIEIINTGHSDRWLSVFNNYWLKVFLISIFLKVPIFLLELFGTKMDTLNEIISILVEIASIYILPLVLLKKEIVSSINLGFKCLLGNFKFSSPMVFVLVFTLFLSIAITTIIEHLNIAVLTYIFSVGLILLSTFTEFAIFIAASLILKEKLLTVSHDN